MDHRRKPLRIELTIEGAEGKITLPDQSEIPIGLSSFSSDTLNSSQSPVVAGNACNSTTMAPVSTERPYLTPVSVGRSTQLERLIRDAQNDIQHYENALLNIEQPERRREANQKITSKRELILPWLEEAVLLCQRLGKRLPSDIVEVAVGCGFAVPPELWGPG